MRLSLLILAMMFPASAQLEVNPEQTSPTELVQNLGTLIAGIDTYSKKCEGSNIITASTRETTKANLEALIDLKGWKFLTQMAESDSFIFSLTKVVTSMSRSYESRGQLCDVLQAESNTLFRKVDEYASTMEKKSTTMQAYVEEPAPTKSIVPAGVTLELPLLENPNKLLERISQLPPEYAKTFFTSPDCTTVLHDMCKAGVEGRIKMVAETRDGFIYRLKD